MQIDLTPLMNGRVKSIAFDFDLPVEAEGELCGFPDGVELCPPISVKGTVSDSSGFFRLECDVAVEYKASCDRCLDGITDECRLSFGRIVVRDNKLSFSSEAFGGVDPEEIVHTRGEFLDITPEVYLELALALPEYHLCRDDCPGMCPSCGKKIGDCTCNNGENQKEIDPRWEKLKKLLENSEEK